jgi:hypothetical protein
MQSQQSKIRTLLAVIFLFGTVNLSYANTNADAPVKPPSKPQIVQLDVHAKTNLFEDSVPKKDVIKIDDRTFQFPYKAEKGYKITTISVMSIFTDFKISDYSYKDGIVTCHVTITDKMWSDPISTWPRTPFAVDIREDVIE